MFIEPFVITLASRNEGKRLELTHWLQQSGLPMTLALNESVGDIEETGVTFLENARLKAQGTPPVIENGWVLGEDSGLAVEALDGTYGISPFPGLYSNRWLTPERRDTLLKQTYPNRMPLDRVTETGVTNSELCQGILALMAGQTNRSAHYCCGLVLWNAASQRLIEVFETTPLQVLDGEPRGQNGFGYDPIMIPMEPSGAFSERTMAEWTVAEKNLVSHRGKAFQKALHHLQEVIVAF